MADAMAFGPITEHTPLKPAIEAWQAYLRDSGRSPHTIKAFMSDMRLLASFLPPDKTLGQISTHDLERFLDWLQHGRGVPCSPKSLARRITTLKAFFRWLHQYGVLAHDPAASLVQRSVATPLPAVLTPAERARVLQVADAMRRGPKPDARPYTLLALLLETGLKKGEVLNLYLPHIVADDPTRAYLFVRYTDPRYRYKERRISLSPQWVEAYREYLAQYQPVDRVFPWSPRRLEYILEDIGKRAGLGRRLSFAMCRWTAALTDWRRGMPPEELQHKLGLSDIQWRDVKRRLAQLDQAIPPEPEGDERAHEPTDAPLDV